MPGSPHQYEKTLVDFPGSPKLAASSASTGAQYQETLTTFPDLGQSAVMESDRPPVDPEMHDRREVVVEGSQKGGAVGKLGSGEGLREYGTLEGTRAGGEVEPRAAKKEEKKKKDTPVKDAAETSGKAEGNAGAEDPRPDVSVDAVLKPSVPVPDNWQKVKGFEFGEPKFQEREVTVRELLCGMDTMGFQGSNLAKARAIIDDMRNYRNPETGAKATVFLGYTSNLISSGLRETIRYLVQNRHVSAIVTTAGGVEEDLIKCLAPTYLGAFSLDGATLRSQGLNRIGNLLVPNSNYCAFEDWIIPLLDKMLEEQEKDGINWTPSTIIRRLGLEINDESSVLYWAAKNDIPVFCPALTDGSIGDMMYFHTFRSSPAALRCDIIADIRKINTLAVRADKSGAVILGGGVVKHHIANANLMRNGAEWAVFVNTASEFDGSDAGARVDEAVSWGKVKKEAKAVKVTAEATIAFPFLVAATWAAAKE